jgi:hypothetical protein
MEDEEKPAPPAPVQCGHCDGIGFHAHNGSFVAWCGACRQRNGETRPAPPVEDVATALLAALRVSRQWIYADGAPIGWDIDRLDAVIAEASAALRQSPAPPAPVDYREALIRVRAHTSYVNPTMELLQGLLASIERIADAALRQSPENRDE